VHFITVDYLECYLHNDAVPIRTECKVGQTWH